MDQELIKTARARVGTLLGETLASKATEAFCLAFGQPAAPFALEAAVESLRPQGLVLEFTPQPAVTAEVHNAVEAFRKSRAWTSVRNALKKVELAEVTRGEVTEVMESGRSEPAILPVQAARLLRYVKVMSVRDNFFKITGPITDEIERGSRGAFRGGLESTVPTQPASSVTQVCWLNRTVRTWVNPRTLAEVVADPSIERVDLPRRLEAELKVSANTVGSPQFRKKFKRTGKGIIVAVIDSEVALNHPALKGRVVHKHNFTSELWGNPGSHGTAVAGIVASNHKNFSGMAPEATIYNYKVLATNPHLSGDDFDGALAVQQAVEDGAHVANCSWGAGPARDGTSREAVACNEAWALGLIIVKSAGNRGPGSRTLTTPADADGVIAVGATDREGEAIQDYSSRGPAETRRRPHLIAPGGIAGGRGITSCLVGGGFGDCGAGTSYAAPHVSGMSALILERNPELTPDEVRDLLLSVSVPLDGIDEDTQGRGLVSLARIT
jgi:serine protease AprX